MNHADHVRLLKRGIPGPGVWADFGSGDGAFTLALAELLGPSGEIHSIDRDGRALTRQRSRLAKAFPDTRLTTYNADFTSALDLPELDGLVVANALHFLPHKEPAVRILSNYLRPDGRFLVVEYAAEPGRSGGNRWVPYPFAFEQWLEIAGRCGLQETQQLSQAHGSFMGGFYSALSFKARVR